MRALPVHGETFIQTKLVIIIGVSGWTDLAMRPPSRPHGAATVRLRDRAKFRGPGGASAADRLQEAIADPSVWSYGSTSIFLSSMYLVFLFII